MWGRATRPHPPHIHIHRTSGSISSLMLGRRGDAADPPQDGRSADARRELVAGGDAIRDYRDASRRLPTLSCTTPERAGALRWHRPVLVADPPAVTSSSAGRRGRMLSGDEPSTAATSCRASRLQRARCLQASTVFPLDGERPRNRSTLRAVSPEPIESNTAACWRERLMLSGFRCGPVSRRRRQGCRCSRARRPSGCDSAGAGHRVRPLRSHRGGLCVRSTRPRRERDLQARTP